MWSKVKSKEEENELLKKAIDFTGDHILYGKAMREVVWVWKNSMLNFLTNKSINRRAYLGHCAVYYKLQIPEYIVRMAWKKLTNEQRRLADLQAENTIKEWEKQYTIKSMNTLKSGSENVTKKGFQTKLQLK